MDDIGLFSYLAGYVYLFLVLVFLFSALFFIFFDVSHAKKFLLFLLGGGVVSFVTTVYSKNFLSFVVILFFSWMALIWLIVLVTSFIRNKKYLLWKENFWKKRIILITGAILLACMVFMQYRYAFIVKGYLDINHPNLFRDAMQVFLFWR